MLGFFNISNLERQIFKIFLFIDVIGLQDVKPYLVSVALNFELLNTLFEYSHQKSMKEYFVICLRKKKSTEKFKG